MVWCLDNMWTCVPQAGTKGKDNLLHPTIFMGYNIGIDTKIEVIVTSHMGSSPQPQGEAETCGELPRSFTRPQWPKSRYLFLFYHN